MRARVNTLTLGLLAAGVMVLSGCGDSPFASIGDRSSGWINEPTVPTTIPRPTTVPSVVEVDDLRWANEGIENPSLDDPPAALALVFSRRQGDRFIQASPAEIAVALPEIGFPGIAPPGARWVSSQLVMNNDGTIASDPSAAFGIWSDEPYTRSRSVAQMIVLRVASDPEGAAALESEGAPSCARFAERTTEQCEIITVADRPTWLLTGTAGSTLVWYTGPYRYELFGRSFVLLDSLIEMSEQMVPLGSVVGVASEATSS